MSEKYIEAIRNLICCQYAKIIARSAFRVADGKSVTGQPPDSTSYARVEILEDHLLLPYWHRLEELGLIHVVDYQ